MGACVVRGGNLGSSSKGNSHERLLDRWRDGCLPVQDPQQRQRRLDNAADGTRLTVAGNACGYYPTFPLAELLWIGPESVATEILRC